MIYVTSDLHGCPLAELKQLLDSAGFSKEDFLFVLGDVIDRGEHGAQLLLWLTEQPNVQLMLGNHEAMLLACEWLFDPVTEDTLAKLTVERLRLIQTWHRNGGYPTLMGLRKLLKEDGELLEGILDYLRDAPLYDTVRAGGRRYILTHAGLGNFSPEKELEDYTPEELLMSRPSIDDAYFEDATVIFGHTPTTYYGEACRGRALRTKTWICIDTGAAMGEHPMLLRLDDGKEFYV